MPKVSVVMPVYNGEKYLVQAIESILGQTFADFEFLIIDDCSTDSTSDILANYARSDSRINIFRQQQNLGVAGALNFGCRQAQGEYIARMDADDISLPKRFSTQIEFLDANPQIIAVGSQVSVIDAENQSISDMVLPTEPNVIRWKLITENCLVHPTVMMRRDEVAKQNFYKLNIPGQDYDLWARLSLIGSLANLPQVLLKYRRWRGNVTAQHRDHQKAATTSIICFLCEAYLQTKVSESTADAIRAITWNEPIHDDVQILHAARLLQEVYTTYQQRFPLSRSESRLIRQDVALKLFALGRRELKQKPLSALHLIAIGLRLSPHSAKIATAYYWHRAAQLGTS